MEVLDELHTKWDKVAYEATDSRTSSKYQYNLKNNSLDDLANFKFEKDHSLPNKSSVSFILHHNHYKFLLLGDAHIDQVNKSLATLGYDKEALAIDFVKVSHHGSRKNINKEFLEMIKTNQYIICPTHDEDSKHPDRETIARIVALGTKKDKNHPIAIKLTKDIGANATFTNEEKSAYHFDMTHILEITFD